MGKLTGIHSKIEEKSRIRSLDIYMPYARTYSYNIEVFVPDGYNVSGLEKLNKITKNDIASFITTTKQNGSIVNVSVNLVYINNFEPASNWPKLLEVMDAAADFTGMKILFEKKN